PGAAARRAPRAPVPCGKDAGRALETHASPRQKGSRGVRPPRRPPPGPPPGPRPATNKGNAPMLKSQNGPPAANGDKDAPARPAPAVSFQRRLLIAEDNELVGQQLKTLLEAEDDLRVDTTRDGRQALEALKQNFYSIFLTDLKMPHLDGMQLIEQIKRLNIPVTVIVMTGYGSIDNALQATRLGAYDYLTKPLDVEKLRVIVRRALSDRAL